jgi:N-methylhydantoinase A
MPDSQRRIRIGIDVGGTFTHAVAIDARSLALLGKVKVSTTHTATEGVARGVVDSLLELLRSCELAPQDVALIAHSTTQATNALLEGDVAKVGIVGMGRGVGAPLARRQTNIRPIPLAPGRRLETVHTFIASDQVDARRVNHALAELVERGAAVIVAAEAFSVDDPRNESLVCDAARAAGLPTTATHHVSHLHGLGVRTRTAVINASMIPRMLGTAEMTERAVREAGITAPLMIMRSDGGVMDIAQMRRRPILTMLSGPAAGVAAALLYARVSDGIFLEVGGTSTDISVIKDGRCQVRTAEVGGQKLHVDTLDVRTVGLAGGSLVYLRDGRIAQVGPRSSHIANLPYLSFAPQDPATFRAGEIAFEGATHLVVQAGDQPLAVTPTCASNLLGLVPDEQAARGHDAPIRAGFDALAKARGSAATRQLATEILDRAAPQVTRLIDGLIKDYKLDRGLVRLVGGGGGAAAVVPYAAQKAGLQHEIVRDADVISAIGVALALVRDTVERTVIDPTEDDIRQIRQQAMTSVQAMGAAPETIQVFVEVDAKRNLLKATAEGATEIRAQDLRPSALSPDARRQLVATSFGDTLTPPESVATAAGFEVWRAERHVRRMWVFRETRVALRVLDATGTIRWASNRADFRPTTVGDAEHAIADLIEQYAHYTDAGVTIPRCFALLGGRITDLSGLVTPEQVLDVLRIELKQHGTADACVLLVDRLV